MIFRRLLPGAAAAFALSIVGAVFGTAIAAPIEIGATVDQTITDIDGDGVGDDLLAANDVYLRTFGLTSVWRTAIEFDLSTFSPGDLVDSAILNLRDQGTSSDGRIDVFGYVGDGTITTSDGSNTSSLVTSLNIVAANGTEDFALDVTAFIEALIASGEAFAGFLLVSESPDFNIGGSDMCSSEATSAICAGFGPRLTVTLSDDMSAVPLPAALPLFLAGLMGVGFAGRRRAS